MAKPTPELIKTTVDCFQLLFLAKIKKLPCCNMVLLMEQRK